VNLGVCLRERIVSTLIVDTTNSRVFSLFAAIKVEELRKWRLRELVRKRVESKLERTTLRIWR